MSYLNTPSIIFTGDIQADVNTVNNDVRHYDNARFKPSFQEPAPPGQSGTKGWWNPDGGSTFRFVDCTVKRCIGPGGQERSDDSVLNAELSGPKDRSSGKMVDLDPQMQMTSELWGVGILITDSTGEVALSGDIHPAGFRDLQQRQFQFPPQNDPNSMRNGQPLGGVWSTTLENLTWGDLSAHPLLGQLQAASAGSGTLSISLSLFGFYYAHQDGRYSMGRVLGTIGPRRPHEPWRFAATRRLYGTNAGVFNYVNCSVEDAELAIDLGMTLPLHGPLGRIWPGLQLGGGGDVQLTAAVAKSQIARAQPTNAWPPPAMPATDFEVIGDITVPSSGNWLMETGGIARLPIGTAAMSLVADHQLLLLIDGNRFLASETPGGYFARCDQNVLRLDPGDQQATDFFVYRYGKPVKGAKVDTQLQGPASGAGGSGRPLNGIPIPVINVPPGKVTIDDTATSDVHGKVTCAVQGAAPGNPRKYIDGQIYLFNFTVSGVELDAYTFDQVIVHLRGAFTLLTNPTWEDVEEIWVQFANLYPIMSKHIVDMTAPQALLERREILKFAFTLPISDPMYMPATRDLSANKMQTLLNWLDAPQLPVVAAAGSPQPAELQDVPAATPNEEIARLTRAKAGVAADIEHFTNFTPGSREDESESERTP